MPNFVRSCGVLTLPLNVLGGEAGAVTAGAQGAFERVARVSRAVATLPECCNREPGFME